jgi:hypothetical protein
MFGIEMKRRTINLLLLSILFVTAGVAVGVAAWPSIRVMILRLQLAAAGLPIDALRQDGKGTLYLILRGPAVTDVPNLWGVGISDLKIENTSVKDLNPLRSASLSEVSLKGSPVNDISPLSKTGVRFIDLLDTGVTNLSPLAQMERLQAVRIPRQQVLRNLTFLKSLHIFVHTETDNSDGGYGWYRKYERMNENRDAEPDGPSNGSQPMGSATNRTSPAAAPRR